MIQMSKNVINCSIRFFGTQTNVALDAVMSRVKRTLFTLMLAETGVKFFANLFLPLYIDATFNREEDKQIVPPVLFFR